MNKTLKLFNAKEADTATTEALVKTVNIPLPNKSIAVAVLPAATDNPDSIIKALGIGTYKAVFLNLGSATDFDEKLMPRLTQIFSRGIATAAVEADALIVDQGMQAGVMSLMGRGVADRGHKSILVGMAPSTDVSYPGGPATGASLELNHSHFILIKKDSPENELAMMSDMVNLLINRPDVQNGNRIVRKVPALAILTGGDSTTKQMLLLAVRQNINVIVIQGSGGLADEVAAAMSSETLPEEPEMAEIVADGKLLIQSFNDDIPKIRKDILSRLGVDNVLMQAWETFADYDMNANIQQKKFDKIQQSIIVIGVCGTALAILQEIMKASREQGEVYAKISTVLYVVLILIPITLTVLITIVNRFKQGNKWLLLRAAAEAIKREIFRYRTRTNNYTPSEENEVIPAQQLSKSIEVITTRTMRTEVNSSYLMRYDKNNGFPPDMYGAKGGDDGFTNLSPDRYVEVRLGDQLNYFQRKSIRLGKQLSRLSVASFIVGGIGTFLAAINQPIWIALTTTIVGAIGTYLAYRQTENTLTKYNQTATNLTNVKSWWMALTPKQQLEQENINTLVDHTEQVLQVELDGWIQQMQNALAELRKNQETKPEANENKTAEDKLAASDTGTEKPGDETETTIVEEAGVAKPETETEEKSIPETKPEETDDNKTEPATVSEDVPAPVGDDAAINNDNVKTIYENKVTGTGSTYVQTPATNNETVVMLAESVVESKAVEKNE